MPDVHANPLIVAISSRTLFDLEDSHVLFERDGLDAYAAFQRSHEDDVLAPGVAFPLVRKLLGLNDGAPPDAPWVEVILISRNSADTGLRIFNSIEQHGLAIQRAAFSNGAPPFPYIRPFGADLFLSAHGEDVRSALAAGIAAATLLPAKAAQHRHDQLRIAFDGDAVIFGDEGERVSREEGLEAFHRSETELDAKTFVDSMGFKEIGATGVFDGVLPMIFDDEGERVSREGGLAAFAEHERRRAGEPLSGGPFRGFLDALHRLQAAFPTGENAPIRTALVTARSVPAHERVIRTLRDWGIRLDEALFLGGRAKGPFLEAFGADIFFDDSEHNIVSARDHVAAGHVPHGVANRD